MVDIKPTGSMSVEMRTIKSSPAQNSPSDLNLFVQKRPSTSKVEPPVFASPEGTKPAMVQQNPNIQVPSKPQPGISPGSMPAEPKNPQTDTPTPPKPGAGEKISRFFSGVTDKISQFFSIDTDKPFWNLEGSWFDVPFMTRGGLARKTAAVMRSELRGGGHVSPGTLERALYYGRRDKILTLINGIEDQELSRINQAYKLDIPFKGGLLERCSLLHWAIMSGEKELVQKLIRIKGVNIDERALRMAKYINVPEITTALTTQPAKN